MKTLSVTAARRKLGACLKKALQGEDIRVVIDGAIVAFRPVKVNSEDYAVQEYGTTPNELDQFVQAANQELDAHRKAHRLKQLTRGAAP